MRLSEENSVDDDGDGDLKWICKPGNDTCLDIPSTKCKRGKYDISGDARFVRLGPNRDTTRCYTEEARCLDSCSSRSLSSKLSHVGIPSIVQYLTAPELRLAGRHLPVFRQNGKLSFGQMVRSAQIKDLPLTINTVLKHGVNIKYISLCEVVDSSKLLIGYETGSLKLVEVSKEWISSSKQLVQHPTAAISRLQGWQMPIISLEEDNTILLFNQLRTSGKVERGRLWDMDISTNQLTNIWQTDSLQIKGILGVRDEHILVYGTTYSDTIEQPSERLIGNQPITYTAKSVDKLVGEFGLIPTILKMFPNPIESHPLFTIVQQIETACRTKLLPVFATGSETVRQDLVIYYSMLFAIFGNILNTIRNILQNDIPMDEFDITLPIIGETLPDKVSTIQKYKQAEVDLQSTLYEYTRQSQVLVCSWTETGKLQIDETVVICVDFKELNDIHSDNLHSDEITVSTHGGHLLTTGIFYGTVNGIIGLVDLSNQRRELLYEPDNVLSIIDSPVKNNKVIYLKTIIIGSRVVIISGHRHGLIIVWEIQQGGLIEMKRYSLSSPIMTIVAKLPLIFVGDFNGSVSFLDISQDTDDAILAVSPPWEDRQGRFDDNIYKYNLNYLSERNILVQSGRTYDGLDYCFRIFSNDKST